MNDALKSLQKELLAAQRILKHQEEDLIFWNFASAEVDSIVENAPSKPALVERWKQRVIDSNIKLDEAKSNILRIQSKIKAAKVLW